MTEELQLERIQAALDAFDDITVTPDTIQAFHVFLTEKMDMPCDVVTKGEFERYRLDTIENSNDELFGLLGIVTLLSDEKKTTKIPLCDLRGVDNRSRIYELLNDYSTWFIHHQ